MSAIADMGRRAAFPANGHSHTFVFDDDYPLPAANLIKMQVRTSGIVLADISPAISVTGKRVTYTYSPEMLGKMPLLVQHYLVLDGTFLVVGELILEEDSDRHQEVAETHVTVQDGEVTVVKVMGMDLVTAQVNIATEKANQTAADALQTAEDRIQTGEDRIQAGQSATAAGNAQAAAEEAAQTAINNSLERFDVATYAEAEPYFTGSRPRIVFVDADEAYYEGEASHYEYYPGKGAALLGVDYNYKSVE